MGTTKVELRGGPAGRTAKLLLDGVEPKGVYRIELTADVSDAIRITTFQFAEAIVEVEGDVVPVYTAKVHIRDEEGWDVIATSSTADTIWQALYDCAKQLELAAKKEARSTET